ncbi:hypothetical protein RJT34_16782 [Clitoria ternatea]|uniref:Uncharacterized protein n=1 Tax=Clitoria ternatea TaxID=43366 RepID=A0AAN9J7S8_CLITE
MQVEPEAIRLRARLAGCHTMLPKHMPCIRCGAGWMLASCEGLSHGIGLWAPHSTRLEARTKESDICRDPKDGELCLSRAKPEETLVEARSDTDMQIVRLTWDAVAALLSHAMESRAPSRPFLVSRTGDAG